jgi:recombination associated protein RdgC
MWFKNLRFFRFTRPFTMSPEAMHERLSRTPFRSCTSLEMFSCGWAPPLGRHSDQLCHAAAGHYLICARKEDKIVPASVVREQVDARVAAVEDEQPRRVSRREREAMRDEVMHDLTARALTRTTLSWACLAPEHGWMVLDAATPRKSDELIGLLSQSLDGLAAAPLEVTVSPVSVMTGWLAGKGLPRHIEIEDECELRDPRDNGGIVRCRRQDLAAPEVQTHLKAGKQVVQLAVHWAGRFSCVICEDLVIKRLRFDDIVREQRGEVVDDDEAALFDADFALMAMELTEFFPQFLEAFGGEDTEAYARLGHGPKSSVA